MTEYNILTQFARLEKGAIILSKYKVYADFECNLKSVDSYEGFWSKCYQDYIPCSFADKLACVDDKLSKPIVVFRSENASYEFVKAIVKEYEYCKKVLKKHFKKNLFMSKEKEQFQLSNTCWICEKLIENDDQKVRDHCHASQKQRGPAHLICNLNLQLTKKVRVIF